MARAKKTAEPKSNYKHIDYIDVNDDGVLEEVAVVKRWDDGSLSYIEVAPLDPIDKGRIKKIISGVHSDKYELWELMGQSKLSNGMNALDFFHSNLVKIKRARGTNNTAIGGGLDSVSATDDTVIGSDFSDPSSATKADDKIIQ